MQLTQSKPGSRWRHADHSDDMAKNHKITMRNLAENLGVSVSVVSRVLSGQASKYRISQATEEGVIAAAKKSNYQPNQLARGLLLRKTSTIGLVIPDLTS